MAQIICKYIDVAHIATLYSGNPTVASGNQLDVC